MQEGYKICGIVGLRTAEKYGFYALERDIIKGMLVVNSLRGAHSTGLAGVDSRDNIDRDKVSIVKAVQSPYYLFDWPRTDEFFSRMLSDFDTIIGHGRYATRGAINADNAHPFEENHITLVHNGGITNFYQLRDSNLDKTVEVDSHLVARLIERDGWEKTLPRLRGAYALVWYDSRDGSMHMARNKERPMVVGKMKKKETILFASEEATILWASNRYDFDLEWTLETEPFNHYHFEQGSIVPVVTTYKEVFTVPATTSTHTTTTIGKDTQTNNRLSKRERRRLAAKLREEARKKSGNVKGVDESPQTKEMFDSVDLIQGELITAEILDTIGMSEQLHVAADLRRVLVKAESAKTPNVEFRFTISEDEEHDYLLADNITGIVSKIHPADRNNTINHVDWIVWLTATTCNKEEEDNFVKIDHDTDGEIRIAKYRLLEMSKAGCAWCGNKIPESSLDQPENLLVTQMNEGEKIACESCTHSYRSSLCPI